METIVQKPKGRRKKPKIIADSKSYNYRGLRFLMKSRENVQQMRKQYQQRYAILNASGVIVSAETGAYETRLDALMAMEASFDSLIRTEVGTHPVAVWAQRVRGIDALLIAPFISEIGCCGQAKVRAKALSKLKEHDESRWVPFPSRLPQAPTDTKKLTYWQAIRKLWDEDTITILAERHGIECFDTRAALHAYCGLHVVLDEATGKMVAPKRKPGQVANWNGYLRTLTWKMSDSWRKCGVGYFRVKYDDWWPQEKARDPEITDFHAKNRARRKCAKLFISLAWEVWREAEGLPVGDPYPIAKLGHVSRIYPEDVTE